MVARRPINPKELGPPVGYANGIEVDLEPRLRGLIPRRLLPFGRLLFVSGQIGTHLVDGQPKLVAQDFARQFDQALANVIATVLAAGGQFEDLVEMTVYVKDMAAYRGARKRLGELWRARMDSHYPAMTLVEVSDLFEEGALVEIRAIAVVGR